MTRSNQIDLLNGNIKKSSRRPGRPRKYPLDTLAFGGSLLSKGNPRTSRPLCSKRPIHVTMKSSLAFGRKSFLVPHAARAMQSTLALCAKRSGIRIYRYQNVGNHIHLVIRLHRRRSWIAFSRSFTGMIKLRLESIWGQTIDRLFDHRPFTRVCTWGREFRNLSDYALKNLLDRWGIPRTKWNLMQFKTAIAVNGDYADPPLELGSPKQLALWG